MNGVAAHGQVVHMGVARRGAAVSWGSSFTGLKTGTSSITWPHTSSRALLPQLTHHNRPHHRLPQPTRLQALTISMLLWSGSHTLHRAMQPSGHSIHGSRWHMYVNMPCRRVGRHRTGSERGRRPHIPGRAMRVPAACSPSIGPVHIGAGKVAAACRCSGTHGPSYSCRSVLKLR